MGGELEKTSMQNKTSTKQDGKTSSRNHKPKLAAIKTTITNNESKREKGKKKKERVSVVSLDKDEKNHEKNVLELIHEKNAEKEDYDLIYNIISKHFFLQTLTNQAKNEIIISMSLYSLKEGKTLYTQGSIGNYWYIVHSGQLNKLMDDKIISTINAGDSFGEHALMNNSPRTYTVVAVTDCKLWVLEKY